MTASRQEGPPLRRKLRELSQLAGIRRDNLYEFLGHELRSLWHISERDAPDVVLAKVTWQLQRLISQLRQEEHRLAARYSYNITGMEDVEPFDLGERQQALADHRGPSAKSSRNYMTQVILPQFEASLRNDPPPRAPDEVLDGAVAGAGPDSVATTIESPPAEGDYAGPRRARWRLVAVTTVVVLLALGGVGVAVWRTTAPDQTGAVNDPTTSAPSLAERTEQPAVTTGETYTQVGGNRNGSPVFNDPHTPSRTHHLKVAFMQEVEVSCKVYAPSMASVEWWYRLASEPYNNEWYSPASTFLNGDPPEGPYEHWVDEAVPDC